MAKPFLDNKNTPSWIIFLIDLGIVFVGLILAYLLRFNFKIPEGEIETFYFVFPLVLGIRAITFLLGKTNRGMIRYTSSADAQRIFIITIIGSAIFILLNIVKFYFVDETFLVPFSIISIEFLSTIFFLVTFRLAVKQIYEEIKNSSKEVQKVVIYGAGEAGIITKRTLDRVTRVNNQVIAFLDDNVKKVGKKIEGVNIHYPSFIDKILETKELDHLIIAFQGINPEKRRELIEKSIQFKVKVSNVPPPSDWINGELTYRQIQNVRIEDLLGRDSIKLDANVINQYITGKVIIVTGAAGSIGSELAKQIAQFNPKKLILLDQAESPLYDLDIDLKTRFGNSFTQLILADIRNEKRMESVFSNYRPQLVFHAAAYKHVPIMEDNPTEAIRTNVQGSKNLVELAGKFNVEKFIMISTDKAVNPTNIMGASKRIAEIYAQAANQKFKTQYITTRFGNVLGSNGSVIPLFRKQIADGGPVTVTHKDITRFFMTIPEACQLVLEAGNMGQGGEIFIFDMGEPVKILDMAKKMIALSGLELGKDIHIQVTGLRPGEKLFEELLATEENTITTHHPKIMIAKVRELTFEQVEENIEQLINLQRKQNHVLMVKKMKELVPEFISNNSVYEKLDRLIN
jgi:FlaA1/EpsC-like NDP-sugar epimerase